MCVCIKINIGQNKTANETSRNETRRAKPKSTAARKLVTNDPTIDWHVERTGKGAEGGETSHRVKVGCVNRSCS